MSNDNDNIRQNDLNDMAHKKIKYLEHKVKQLESRIPKQFADVKFLNYRARKRILVSDRNKNYLSIIKTNEH